MEDRKVLRIDCELSKLHTVEIVLEGKNIVGVVVHGKTNSITFGSTSNVVDTVYYEVR